MANATKIYDVLVIGSGPGGLAIALGVARQLYSALVFDSKQYRNAPTQHMHNVLSWDHRPPAEFRAAAKKDILDRYDTVQFKEAKITSAAKKEDDTFEVTDEQGTTYQGKKLVFATGITDVFPDIKGFGDLWGKSIFHCLFCHGFEERGAASAGLLATGPYLTQPPMLLHVARMAAPLAKDLTVYANGNEEVTALMQKEFQDKPLTIESRKITSLEAKGESVTVRFEDGTGKEERFLVNIPQAKINGPYEQLGLDVDDTMTFIKTTPPFNEASVSGVFAVGDCATGLRSVPQAHVMGSFAAAGLVAQLGAAGRL